MCRALHFILFVRYSIALYWHNNPSQPRARAVPPSTTMTDPPLEAEGQSASVQEDRPRWRKAVLGFTLAAFITFALNLSFLTWALARSGSDNNGIGTLTTGTCSSMKKLNVGIHVVINILSTVLLAGSNYCMQCLSAPDRHLVNAIHMQGRWLDVGIPSFRNIIYISQKQRRLWWLLGLSSLPLHLL